MLYSVHCNSSQKFFIYCIEVLVINDLLICSFLLEMLCSEFCSYFQFLKLPYLISVCRLRESVPTQNGVQPGSTHESSTSLIPPQAVRQISEVAFNVDCMFTILFVVIHIHFISNGRLACWFLVQIFMVFCIMLIVSTNHLYHQHTPFINSLSYSNITFHL